MKKFIVGAWHIVVANIRMFLHDKYPKLLREHVREQIDYRLASMNQKCYVQGACIKCGCITPDMQFANKACPGNCYPKMMNKKNWNKLVNVKSKLKKNRLWKGISSNRQKI